MNKLWKKSLSLVLVVLMVVSMMPVSVLAADEAEAPVVPVVEEITLPDVEETEPEEPVVSEAPVEEPEIVVEETPVEETETVVEEAPAEETETVVEETPVEETETETVVEDAPAEETETVVEETPAEETETVVEEPAAEEEEILVVEEVTDEAEELLAVGDVLATATDNTSFLVESGTNYYYLDILDGSIASTVLYNLLKTQSTFYGTPTSDTLTKYSSTYVGGYKLMYSGSMFAQIANFYSTSLGSSASNPDPLEFTNGGQYGVQYGTNRYGSWGYNGSDRGFQVRFYSNVTVEISGCDTGSVTYDGTTYANGDTIKFYHGGTITLNSVDGYNAPTASGVGVRPTTSGTLTVTYTSAETAKHNVTLVVNGDEYGDASLSAEGELAEGTSVTVTATPLTDTANADYSVNVAVEGADIDENTNTFLVGTGDVTVTVTFSAKILNGNATANVNYNSGLTTTQIKKNIFDAVVTGSVPAGVTVDDVTIQYYPYHDAGLGEDGFNAGMKSLGEAAPTDDTSLNPNTYYDFGERFLAGGSATEKVRITWGTLYIESEITLVDNRTAPDYTISSDCTVLVNGYGSNYTITGMTDVEGIGKANTYAGYIQDQATDLTASVLSKVTTVHDGTPTVEYQDGSDDVWVTYANAGATNVGNVRPGNNGMSVRVTYAATATYPAMTVAFTVDYVEKRSATAINAADMELTYETAPTAETLIADIQSKISVNVTDTYNTGVTSVASSAVNVSVPDYIFPDEGSDVLVTVTLTLAETETYQAATETTIDVTVKNPRYEAAINTSYANGTLTVYSDDGFTTEVTDLNSVAGGTYYIKIDTETGYTFQSLTVTDEDGTAVNATVVNGVYRFTAEYAATQAEKKTYTITATATLDSHNVIWDANGGAWADGATSQTVSVNYGAAISQYETAPTRTGYEFKGWEGYTADAKMGTEDVTYKAIWEIISYTISFNSNGGSAVDSITQAYGTAVTAPTEPTLTGYSFGGWYADAELGTAYTFTTMPAENITLYAKWNPANGTKYTVNHMLENLDGEAYTVETENMSGVTGDTTAASARTYTGFTAGTVTQSTIAADGTTVIEIVYTRNTYTVTWIADDEQTVVSYKYGAAVSTPAAPTKNGYTFNEWTPQVAATMGAANANYTATWTTNNYTITFDSNGGSDVNSITQAYLSEVAAPTAPTKDKFVFDQWVDSTGTAVEWPVTMPLNGATYTATWKADNNENGVADENETAYVQVEITGADYGTVDVTAGSAKMIVTETDTANRYEVVFDSATEGANVVSIAATAKDTKNDDGDVDYVVSPASGTTTATVTAGQTATVNVEFATRVLNVADTITATINLYSSNALTHIQNLKTIVLDAAFGAGNYTASEYTVEILYSGNFVDVTSILALGDLANGFAGDTFRITWNAKDGEPAVSKETTVNVKDSRTAPTVAHNDTTYTVDALDDAFLANVKKNVTVNSAAAGDNVTLTVDATTLPGEGLTADVTISYTVTETSDYLGKTDTFTVSVTNQAYLSPITFSTSNIYKIVVKDKDGTEITSGTKVDDGTYTVTVTPAANEGWYVTGVKVNGDNAAAGTYSNYAYTTTFEVVNGTTSETTYAVTAEVNQRKIVGLKDAGESYQVKLEDNMTLAELKAEIYKQVVDTTKSVYAPASETYEVTGITEAAEGMFDVTITYPGDEAKTYPAVSGTFTVNVSKQKTDVVIPTIDTIKLVESVDEATAAVKTAILNANKDLTETDVTVTLNEDEVAVKQGASDVYTVTIDVKETTKTKAYNNTLDVNVEGVVQDAKVEISTTENGTAEYDAATQTLTATPAEGYFVDTITVNDGEVENIDGELGKAVEYDKLVNGTGMDLGVVPEYTVSVVFSQHSITIPETADMTYYIGMPDAGVDKLNELVITALETDVVDAEGNVVVKDIIYNPDALKDQKSEVRYLAREAGTVPYTVNVAALDLGTMLTNVITGLVGNVVTVDVPVDDMWLSIGDEWVDYPAPTNAQIKAIVMGLYDDYGMSLANMSEAELKALLAETIANNPDLANYYAFYGAHQFGDNVDDTEIVALTIDDDKTTVTEMEGLWSNKSTLTLKDTRAETYIVLNEGVAVTYNSYTEADLLAKLVAGVYTSDGTKIEDAEVIFTTDVEGLPAMDSVEVTVEYAGDAYNYQDCEATGTFTINKAPVNVSVDNRIFKHPDNLPNINDGEQGLKDIVLTDPDGVETIRFIVGLDVSDVNMNGDKINGIMGNIQLLLPVELQDMLNMLSDATGINFADGASMTVAELQTALDELGEYIIAFAPQYETMVNVLMNMLGSLPTETADVMITIGGTMPTATGAYLVGAVSADNNYEFDYGAGIVVIAPNGIKAEIDWVNPDENNIFTNSLLTGNYLDAYVVSVANEAGASVAAAEEQLVELFLGVDVDGNITLTRNEEELDVGAYVEIAMVANWGNEFYYSEPLIRPVVVIAESLDVDFVDETGAVNNVRLFEFDNEQQRGMEGNLKVTYKQDGNGYSAGDEVTDYNVKYLYVGTQTNAMPIVQGEAPVHAGVYAVTAIVTVRDGDMITHAGVGHGILTIEPTDSTLEISNKAVMWEEGKSHGIADMIEATSTVPGLTPDTTIISAGLSANLDEIDGLEDINGNVNVDMPAWLDKIIDTLGVLEAGRTGNGITTDVFNSYIETIKNALTELGIDTAAFDEIVAVVDQLPDNATLTFYDDVEYSEVGAYLVFGVVTDSDHYPSVGAGIMVIYPNATEVELQFEEDWNDNSVFTWEALKYVNLEANAHDKDSGEINADATAKVVNLYFGFTDNGEFLLTSVAAGESLEEHAQFDNGAYTQMAVLLDLGNQMYYAEPIARGFLIVPNPAIVEFVDDNGDVNNDRHFVFNNQQHEMPVRVTVAGEVVEPGDNLTVNYVGVQTNGVLYNSAEAPVHAGSYVVTATYAVLDELGRYNTVGAAVGAMVIEPAETTTTVDTVTREYENGVTTATKDMVHVDTDSGVNPDTTIITAAIKTDGTFSENLLGAIESNVNIDLPAWTDGVLAEIDTIQDGITVEGFIAAIEKAEAKIIELAAEADVEVEPGFLDELIAVVEQLPDNFTLTFNDAPAYSEVGAYLVIGVVTDSDHYPSMDAGVLVIYPDVDEAKLHWIYEDSNNVFTLDTLSIIDLGAYATLNGEKDDAGLVPFQVLYLGVNADTNEITITRDQADLDVGIYTEIAYVLEVDSEMYVAEPIVRTVVITPNIYDIQAEDETYTYDGTAKGIEVTAVLDQFGNDIIENGTLTVTYMGVTAAVDGYMSSNAPTEAGLYSVVITFATYDAEGNVTGAGSKTVTLLIEKADPDFDMVDNTVTYNGSEHFVTEINKNDMEYVAVVETEDGVNLIFTEGLSEISDLLGDDIYDLTSLKTAIEEAIKTVEDLDIDSQFVDQLLETIKAANDSAVYKITVNGANPVNVGEYNVYAVSVPSGNYNTDVSQGKLTIAPIEIVVDAVDAQYKYYGDSDPAELTATVKYYDHEGNEIAVADLPADAGLEYTVSRAAGEDAGNYALSVEATVANDNFVLSDAAESSVFTIMPAVITLMPTSDSKVYGASDPTFSYTYSVIHGSVDVVNTLNVNVTREAGENVGTYPMSASYTKSNNYIVYLYNESVFAITKAAVTVVVDDKTITYGDDMPAEFTKTVTGDLSAEQIGLNITCEADGKTAGTYDIVASYTESDNYDVTVTNGTLTISPKSVTVTVMPEDTTIYYGDSVEYTYTTEDGAVLKGDDLGITYTYKDAEGNVVEAPVNAGTYTITATTSNENYDITVENATLTIEPAEITIAIADQTKKVDEKTDPELTYEVEVKKGKLTEDELNALKATIVVSREEGTAAGEYAITATYGANDNYKVTVEDGTLTITLGDYVCWDTIDTYYTDVSEALRAEYARITNGDKAGETAMVQMLKDYDETKDLGATDGISGLIDYVMIYPGLTLDVASYTLTADYVIGVDGSYLTGNTQTGKVVMNPDNLVLLTENSYVSGGYNVLPIWNGSAFQFALFQVSTTGTNRGLKVTEDQIYFQFVVNSSAFARKELWIDGTSDNEISFVVRIEWENDVSGGIAYQDFVYTDSMVQTVANGGQDFMLAIDNYTELGINPDTMHVYGYVLTDSGTTAPGIVY